MPVLFLLTGPKWVFRPAKATRCSDKRRSAPPCQLSRLSGQKCGNATPKTVKISNFGHKFVPQGRLVCNIFTKFSAFVRSNGLPNFSIEARGIMQLCECVFAIGFPLYEGFEGEDVKILYSNLQTAVPCVNTRLLVYRMSKSVERSNI